MNKQKASAPNDPSIKTPKIRKFTTLDCTQTPSTSQSINRTQIIDPTPVLHDDFEQLTQIWNSAKNNKLNIAQDQSQIRYTEVKDQIAQATQEIERWHKKLSEAKEENEKIAKSIEEKCEKRKEIIKNQNLIANFRSQIQEHTNAIMETKKHCEESRQRVAQVYNNTSLKQQETITNFAQKLNDQILTRKEEFEKQMEFKRSQILTLQTVGLKTLEKEMNEKLQLRNEMNSKFEKSQSTLDKNKEKYHQEIAQLLEINKEKESNLKFEKEEKYKLEVEASEDLARYDELYSKYQALQIEDSEYESQMRDFTSSLSDLKEEETSLINELDELKKNHLSLVSNKDLELAEYKRQLQDLKLSNEKAIDELRGKTSTNEELSKTAAEMAADNEQLVKSLENKKNEIMNVGTTLSNLLDENKKMVEDIEAQNREIITLEKNICDNKAMFKTRNTKQDEAAKREDEIIAELAMIEQQLSNESEEIAKLHEEQLDQKIKSAENVKKLLREIKEKDQLNTKEEEAIEDLKREIGRKESKYEKKIQDAKYASQKCQSAGHEKQIKEQESKIDTLTRELSSEKLKRKQANAKRNAMEAKEKEKHENQLQRMESHYEDLDKVLSTLKAEYAVLVRESKAKDAKDRETPSACSTPKPILKSAMRGSPPKVQKVQFDLGPSQSTKPINALDLLEESERRFAAIPIGGPGRPDWLNLKIGKTSDQPDSTSPIVTEPLASQTPKPRKFFKTSRLAMKKTSG